MIISLMYVLPCVLSSLCLIKIRFGVDLGYLWGNWGDISLRDDFALINLSNRLSVWPGLFPL
jgi:hypothetical protein